MTGNVQWLHLPSPCPSPWPTSAHSPSRTQASQRIPLANTSENIWEETPTTWPRGKWPSGSTLAGQPQKPQELKVFVGTMSWDLPIKRTTLTQHPRRPHGLYGASLAHFLFTYFWLCRVFVAVWAFPCCGEQGLLSYGVQESSHFRGFSCGGAWALEHRLCSFGTRA